MLCVDPIGNAWIVGRKNDSNALVAIHVSLMSIETGLPVGEISGFEPAKRMQREGFSDRG